MLTLNPHCMPKNLLVGWSLNTVPKVIPPDTERGTEGRLPVVPRIRVSWILCVPVVSGLWVGLHAFHPSTGGNLLLSLASALHSERSYSVRGERCAGRASSTRCTRGTSACLTGPLTLCPPSPPPPPPPVTIHSAHPTTSLDVQCAPQPRPAPRPPRAAPLPPPPLSPSLLSTWPEHPRSSADCFLWNVDLEPGQSGM